MIRTQVYLTSLLSQEIELVAKSEGKPKAQIIREALTDGIKRKRTGKNAGSGLLGLAQLGKKLNLEGPTDLSENIDKYLYDK